MTYTYGCKECKKIKNKGSRYFVISVIFLILLAICAGYEYLTSHSPGYWLFEAITPWRLGNAGGILVIFLYIMTFLCFYTSMNTPNGCEDHIRNRITAGDAAIFVGSLITFLIAIIVQIAKYGWFWNWTWAGWIMLGITGSLCLVMILIENPQNKTKPAS